MADAVVNPTLAQIRTRVRFFIDEPVQANFQDSDLNWAINTAQQNVAMEISLVDGKYFVNTTPTVITTVANQRFYPLAADFWAMIRLEDVNSGLRIDFSRFEDQDNFFVNSIPPIVGINQVGYAVDIVGQSLSITPTPSQSGITAQYWYMPVLPDMSVDTSTSSIPRAFIDLVAIQAAIDAGIKDENVVADLEKQYARIFNQLVRATRTRQSQNPRGVTRVATPLTGWAL